MNQKGITMINVVVIIIVMLIIATVSIIAGNQIIDKSKDYKIEQELESVRAAVLRKKSDINMSGVLTPLGESYVGIVNPILKDDGTDQIVATGWYLLDEENLEKLGIYDATSRFIVNYEHEIVLATQSEDYLEQFVVADTMIKAITQDILIGSPLKNKTESDTTGKMVKNKESDEVYGTDWYVVKPTDFPASSVKYMKNKYLVNYKTMEFVKMTSDFEEI